MGMGVQLYDPFLSGVKRIFAEMAGVEVEFKGAFSSENEEIVSYGVTSIITFTGKVKGRFMIDMESGLAIALAQIITGLGYTSIRDSMVLETISEMTNIISGGAVSTLNNAYSLGLWLAPPYVFAGKDAVICIPKIQSASVECMTKYGKMKVNVAFERSEEIVGR